MSSRLTIKQKKNFSIHPTPDGCWSGVCWDCGEIFKATHTSVTQMNVVNTIKQHQTEVHHRV